MNYIDTDTLSGYDVVNIKDGESCVLVPLEDYYAMAVQEGQADAYRDICRKLIEKM